MHGKRSIWTEHRCHYLSEHNKQLPMHVGSEAYRGSMSQLTCLLYLKREGKGVSAGIISGIVSHGETSFCRKNWFYIVKVAFALRREYGAERV